MAEAVDRLQAALGDRYQIEHEIGRGGMATVYLVRDLKHQRSVALKLLHTEAAAAFGAERFRREIDLVARLQHPHIVPLYDSGDVAPDVHDPFGTRLLYYVMPLVAGASLRNRITQEGPLPLADVLRVTTNVASALDYAHRQGVVHRDVKPENILLSEGHAAVTDFGIARPTLTGSDARLTETGIFIGTPAYMSPEQATGASDIDARSDIYSLACVVFEMLTGEAPFRGWTAPAIIAKHIAEPFPSIRAARPELPSAVDEVLRTATAKDPGRRFATAREFAEAFEAALRGTDDSTAEGQAPRPRTVSAPRRRRAVIAGAGVALTLAAGVVVGVVTRARTEVPSIAVLPFVNLSDDRANEYFSDGMTDELTDELAQLGRLRVAARTSAFAFKGKNEDVRIIGEKLGVSKLIEGAVQRDGQRLRVTARLIDVETGERDWSESYERDWRDVLALQSELARTISDHLRVRLVKADSVKLATRHTEDPEAYDSYLKGRFFFNQRTALALGQAVVHFQRALAIDSTYARAYAGLADSYSILAWSGGAAPRAVYPLAERAALRALALDTTLAEAHTSLGIVRTFFSWDYPAAEREFARAIALDSTSALAHQFNTWPLAAGGRLGEALASIRRARDIDPLSLIVNTRVGTVLALQRRFAEAEAAIRKALEIDPDYPIARAQLARVLAVEGRFPDAVAALPRNSTVLGSYESGLAGYVLARAGRRADAVAEIRALEARTFVPADGIAAIYVGLGDTDAAFAWLEKAYEVRAMGLIFVATEPLFEPLHGDPRFAALVARIDPK